MSDNNAYIELFATRGDKYHKAMKNYPYAREQEFLQAMSKVLLKGGMAIGDVPAGGEYLKNLLPKNTIYFPYEPCQSFYEKGKNSLASENLLPLPFHDGVLDVVFSIAGVHHIDDKTDLFKEIHRTLAENGQFVLSDVYEDSKVANFLDGFMGSHNSTGHKGFFLNSDTIKQLKQSGFEIVSCDIEKFYWVFDSKEDMAVFCNTLFDMDKSSITNTIYAIHNELGVTTLDNGQIGMEWELMTIVAKKI